MTSVNARNLLTPRAQAANEVLQVVAFPSQMGQQITTASGESVCVPEMPDTTLSILRCMALGMTRKDIAATRNRSLYFLYHHFNFNYVAEVLGVPGRQRPGIIRACYRLGLLTCNTQLADNAWIKNRLSPILQRTLEYSSSGMTIAESAAVERIDPGIVCARRERLMEHLRAKNMTMAVTVGYATQHLTDNFHADLN